MKWEKKGIVYGPQGELTWAETSALQPTPILLGDVIRVYVGFRDQSGVSRVGFVEVDATNPSTVLRVSSVPALDVGEAGAFDSRGVVPTAVVNHGTQLWLYYAGYQLPSDVRFLVFGGLAISTDNGQNFVRKSRVPILDRTDDELLFRVPHSVLYDQGQWKVWYGAGSKFIPGKNKTLPVYDIRYIESKDGFTFNGRGQVCLTLQNDEHRLGRPYVFKEGHLFKMFFGYSTELSGYRLGYAESKDGINWIRKDDEVGIDVSPDGWDSQMIAYPSIIRYLDTTYLFYNGNNMGADGFGYAILDEHV
jgi:hypothetical protein